MHSVARLPSSNTNTLSSQGSNIVSTLLSLPSQIIVQAITRRQIPRDASNLNSMIEQDSSKWPDTLRDLTPTPDAYLSALGTTRGQAGGFEAQRKIDYDLNLALAQAAKAGGIKVFVLISSGGSSAKARMPYLKMKGELEAAVKELGFPHTVILRPGLLLGSREDSRPPEAMVRFFAKGLASISKGLTDFWVQDAGVVAKAAVSAAARCVEGKQKEGVWMLEQADIVRLGRTEWKDT